jgi:hypothetical protein
MDEGQYPTLGIQEKLKYGEIIQVVSEKSSLLGSQEKRLSK